MKQTIFTFFLLINMVAWCWSQDPDAQVLKKHVPITVEKQLSVSIDFGNGYIDLMRGDSGKVFEGEFTFRNEKPGIRYEIVQETGHLTIRFNGEHDSNRDDDRTHSITSFHDIYQNQLNLKLSPVLPIQLEGELGVVKGSLDFTGLPMKSLNLEIGVSKVTMVFNTPNPTSMEHCSVSGGVGKLKIRKLGNAHFRHLSFEGGLGSYVLDLSGDIQGAVTANIDIGLGKLILYLPRNVGTRIKVDKSLFSSFSIDDCYVKNDFYYNNLWGKTENQLDIRIATGMGKVRVEWADDESDPSSPSTSGLQ